VFGMILGDGGRCVLPLLMHKWNLSLQGRVEDLRNLR
jgi:hypothetical protein